MINHSTYISKPFLYYMPVLKRILNQWGWGKKPNKKPSPKHFSKSSRNTECLNDLKLIKKIFSGACFTQILTS